MHCIFANWLQQAALDFLGLSDDLRQFFSLVADATQSLLDEVPVCTRDSTFWGVACPFLLFLDSSGQFEISSLSAEYFLEVCVGDFYVLVDWKQVWPFSLDFMVLSFLGSDRYCWNGLFSKLSVYSFPFSFDRSLIVFWRAVSLLDFNYYNCSFIFLLTL